MGRLAGKVAIVTGAGSGMGRAAVQLFAAEGAMVVAADINEASAVATVEAARAAGGEAIPCRVDVTRAAELEAMVALAIARYGGLHVLHNNAGILPADDAGLLATGEATWERVQEVNVKGTWLGCGAAIPAMIRSGGGSIINVSSMVAFLGSATAQVAYTASKGAVLAMTREIAVEYARRGIRVNALCPGPIDTGLLSELLSDPQQRARRFVHIPMGRIGRPEELARAALFLACDDSSFMTGTALIVDGGITAAYVTPEGEPT